MKKQVEEKIVESKCQNPFHYLRRHENLSSQRPTKCPCRNAVVTKVYRNQPITEFASEIQFSEQGTNVHRKENKSSSQENLYFTRTDIPFTCVNSCLLSLLVYYCSFFADYCLISY